MAFTAPQVRFGNDCLFWGIFQYSEITFAQKLTWEMDNQHRIVYSMPKHNVQSPPTYLLYLTTSEPNERQVVIEKLSKNTQNDSLF